MKKIISLCLVLLMIFAIVGCSSSGHEGEAKTPSGSSIQKGRNYQEVVKDFENKGFTNIKLVKQSDLIFGWLTKDGEVESVSVDGDTKYSPDTWYKADVEVIITYHTFPENNDQIETEPSKTELSNDELIDEVITVPDNNEQIETEPDQIIPSSDDIDEILTIENCPELANLFSIHAEVDPVYVAFSDKFRGKIVEFDGSIDYLDNHTIYNPFNGSTKVSEYDYDILVSYGDYSADSQVGPTIKIENISSRKLGYDISKNLPSFMYVGSNVHIVAQVGGFNEDTGIFAMYFEKITKR